MIGYRISCRWCSGWRLKKGPYIVDLNTRTAKDSFQVDKQKSSSECFFFFFFFFFFFSIFLAFYFLFFYPFLTDFSFSTPRGKLVVVVVELEKPILKVITCVELYHMDLA